MANKIECLPQKDSRVKNPLGIASDYSNYLSVQGISKSFPKGKKSNIQVLDNVFFTGSKERITVLLGPSGCGKSTILRIVAGLEKADRGQVVCDGAKVIGPGRDRGMVFQQYTCFPWLTVLQNIEYGLRINGDQDSIRSGIAKYFLERVKLQEFSNSYPNQLSGGMRQRVSIARVMATYPSLLIMDEPFGALDPETRWQMQEMLLEIIAKEKTTVLLVTHDIDEAIFLGDQIIFLSKNPGKVRETLKPDFKNLVKPRKKEELYDTVGHRELEHHIIGLMRSEGCSANS